MMEKINKLLADLSLEQRAEMERALLGRVQAGRGMIPKRTDRGQARLSFSQERLWFLQEFYPGLVAYNEASAYRVKGSIDRRLIEASVNLLFERHELLRSTFSAEVGIPYQVVRDYQAQPLAFDDLSRLPFDDRLPAAHERMQAEINRPFDLQVDVPLRAHLYQLEAQEFILLLVRHHIVSDGWSARRMIEELIETLHALMAGKQPALAELPIQYADFAEWERSWLQGERLEKLVAYWRNQLDGLAPLALPVDFSLPAQPSFRGGMETFVVAGEVLKKLREIALRENATLFMVMLAAYQALLFRYSQQEDFAVGAPVAGRNRIELEPLIGFFTNNLTLRADLSGKPSYRDLLRRVRKTCLEAYDHQELPFARLVELLNPERRLHRNPLFDVTLQLRRAYQPPQFEYLHVTRLELEKTHSKFNLEMELEEYEDHLAGTLIINRDLFMPETASRIASNFNVLLRAIAQNPDQDIRALELLSQAERRLVIETWNQTDLDWRSPRRVHELFEDWAAQQPDAPAVITENLTLTYAQLNSQANRLAQFLRAKGVGAESVVALLLEHSAEMIVGILAALKAGSAYLPLDPDYPDERLEYMLHDSGAVVLATFSRHAARLKTGEIPVILLDEAQEVIDQCSGENLVLARSPRSLVYLMYTSGSTGLPKGVMIEDAGLANLALAMRETSGWGPGDRVLQFAALNFDISVEEIFGALCNGAALVIRSQKMMESVAAFLGENQKFGVTVWDVPAAFWHLVAAEGSRQQLGVPQSLCNVISGGDRIRTDLLAAWKEWAGEQIRLQNFYGPTEVSVAASWANLDEPAEYWRNRRDAPIGRPLPNVRVYILDELLQPCPVGVVGDLYVGGVGVGRGYWMRPELTARSFLPDPFSAGGRLYCTGDRARWLVDGQIEFAGRADHQVKIRGHRVELGEIETALRRHPRVRDCVVILAEGSSTVSEADGEMELAAYVVSDRPRPGLEQELRSHLAVKLPSFMLPTAYVFLDDLPLTPSGKIDRKTLPAPVGAGVRGDYAAPVTQTEKRLAEIWADGLGVERVGLHDNFFDLGGHSLLAMQLIASLCQAFPVEITLRMLFEGPTIAGLAEKIGWLLGASESGDRSADREEGEI